MIIPYHIPSSFLGDVQLFPGDSPSNYGTWKTWVRPRGVSMISIIAISGGGGGGGGHSAAAGNARGGGAGGGSSGSFRLIIPAYLLPDTLYVSTGIGGAGGAATVAGSSGTISAVAVRQSSNALDLVALSNQNAPGGGPAGTASGGGSPGGTAGSGTSATGANTILACLGVFVPVAGQAGTGGGAHTGANGTNIVLANSLSAPPPCNAGAGGAGTQSADFTGGVVTTVANSFTSNYRPMASGSVGHQLWYPLYSYGGLGGDSSNNGVGSPGGDATSYGGGGGGGGGGTTGGKGGNGGPGLVIIMAW